MSIKTLNPQTLNKSARVYLESILAKDVHDLTAYEIGFLKARVVYLTADQRDFFADALNGKLKGVDYKEKVEEPSKVVEKNVTVDEDGKKIISVENFDRSTLIQMMKDADLKFDVKMTNQDMVDLLNNR
jgi:hypothetical protein